VEDRDAGSGARCAVVLSEILPMCRVCLVAMQRKEATPGGAGGWVEWGARRDRHGQALYVEHWRRMAADGCGAGEGAGGCG
jgi:hypothetical protein